MGIQIIIVNVYFNSQLGCVIFVLFLVASPTESPPPPYAIAIISILCLVVVVIIIIIGCVLCMHFVVFPLNGRGSLYGEFIILFVDF